MQIVKLSNIEDGYNPVFSLTMVVAMKKKSF